MPRPGRPANVAKVSDSQLHTPGSEGWACGPRTHAGSKLTGDRREFHSKRGYSRRLALQRSLLTREWQTETRLARRILVFEPVPIGDWRWHYNEDRPHSALGSLSPREFAASKAQDWLVGWSQRPHPAIGTESGTSAEPAAGAICHFDSLHHSKGIGCQQIVRRQATLLPANARRLSRLVAGRWHRSCPVSGRSRLGPRVTSRRAPTQTPNLNIIPADPAGKSTELHPCPPKRCPSMLTPAPPSTPA